MVQRRLIKRIFCAVIVLFLISIIFNIQIDHLLFSSPAEEVKPTISILTIQSYPKVGGQWTVSFKVEGTADLKISAAEKTTWDINQNPSCDLQFKTIQTNEEEIPINWNNDQVIIENFSSSMVVYETSNVFSLGRHVLKFTFGDMTVYAYNDASNWWNHSWGYRKEITINHNLIPGNLSNFPILINLTDTDLQNKTLSNGEDIVFVLFSDNSTKLNHEIEKFNETSGELIAWVNITSISTVEDKKIWMYYNNTCENQENAVGTWDLNYLGVWHLNNSMKEAIDSTVNNMDGNENFSPDSNRNVTGKINGANWFDGNEDYINWTSNDFNFDYNDSFTISFFMNSSGGEDYLIAKGDSNIGYRLRKSTNGDLEFFMKVNGASRQIRRIVNTETFLENGWHHVVVTYNGSRTVDGLTIYVDGEIASTQGTTDSIIAGDSMQTDKIFYVGRNSGSTAYWYEGYIDEIRISNINRSQNWIKTMYININNYSELIDIGIEESAAPIISNLYPLDGTTTLPNPPEYFEITIFDPNPETMNITWRTNASGNWETFNITNGGGSGVDDGTYNVTNTSWVTTYDQIYYWSVNVSDGTHWTNETYQFMMHQFTPTINSFILQNQTGSKLDNQTGSLTCLEKYTFLINITDKNGWGDIGYINLTCWFDHGDDNSNYNETFGGNLNMFLQYENTTGIGIFRMRWPDDEVIFSSSNCSETIINETTRLINISFAPNKQVRYAVSNNTWNVTSDIFDDPYSWNVNCSINDTQNNQETLKNEFGVGKYVSITATDNIEITGAPGMAVSSTIMNVTYSCNAAFHLYVYMEKNFTQVNGTEIICIADNLSLLKDANSSDLIVSNTSFTGIGVNNYISIFNTSAPDNNHQQSVDVKFGLNIPFGTWGKYSSIIAKKIDILN